MPLQAWGKLNCGWNVALSRTPLELPEELELSVDELGKELSALTDPKPPDAPTSVVVDQQQPIGRQQPNFVLDKTIL